MRRIQRAVAVFEGGRAPLGRDCRLPREVGNGPLLTPSRDMGPWSSHSKELKFCQRLKWTRKQILPKSSQKGVQARRHLDFSSMRAIQDF